MIFVYGKDRFNPDKIVYWDSLKVINAHKLVLGASGTGKTTFLKSFINTISTSYPDAVKFYVFDVHGDLDIKGDNVKHFFISETGEYGLNPLKISPDKDYGGVRKKVKSFISTINRTSRKLGVKQEHILSEVLLELYSANGFYHDDPRTWSLDFDPRNSKYPKKYPTLKDLRRFLDAKVKQVFLGTGHASIKALEELNKKVRLLEKYRTMEIKEVSDDSKEQIKSRIDKLKEECKQLYASYIDKIETGRELDALLKYHSYDLLKSVLVYIVNLEMTGIFRDKYPSLDEDKDKNVALFKIEALSRDEQKMFIDFYLEDIFLKSRERGLVEDVDTFIVLDEASIFVSPDSSHIINVIIKEGRKFGIGLILASQSLSHFSDDILSNTSTKIILGVDETEFDTLIKKLKVTRNSLANISPRRTALIRQRTFDNLSNKYKTVILDYKNYN